MGSRASPNCGHDAACPACGHAARNGAAPEEVSGWAIYPTPPEMIEWIRQTFDEAEYLAAAREVEQSGGVRFEDFIGDIERTVDGND
jgi:hypothetical protein